MPSESLISIELAVGAAAIVLTARLFALISATRGVPGAHSKLVDAVNGGDLAELKKKMRGLGRRSPYGEVAAELVEAGAGDAADRARRGELVAQSAEDAKKRMIRRTHQGQATDSLALAVAAAAVLFSRGTLPDGPIFWSLIGAVVVLLLFSLIVRSQLQGSIVTSLEALKTALIARPELPSLSGEAIACIWCGGTTHRAFFGIEAKASGLTEDVEGMVCTDCGKLVATLSGVDGTPSSNS